MHKLCGTGFSFPVGRGLSLVEARLADARDLAVVSLAVQLAIVLLEGLQVQNNITFVAYVKEKTIEPQATKIRLLDKSK